MLSALYISTFMIRASFAIMLISFPIYIIGLKSYFLFGLVVSSSPIFELLTVLGLGAYIDRHGRKSVLMLGLLLGSLALFALLLTKEAVPLFIINAFHGMSAAAILVASLALLADYAPPEKRGRAMGAFDFVNIFGWISGFGIGGVLIDVYRDNIGMTFVVAGAMGLAAFVWALINVREPHKEAHQANEISFRMIASVLKQRSIVLLIAPWFIIYLLISTLLTFTSKAGTQELGLSGLELGALLGGGGGIFLVTQVIYGHLSDKYGRTRIMIVGTVGIVGIMLVVGGVFLSAPAAVPPATKRIMAVTLSDHYEQGYLVDQGYLLQSDFGLYLLDANGTVLREMSPPEGGFGTIMTAGYPFGKTHTVLLVTHDSLELFSLDSESITWAMAASEPRLIDSHGGNNTQPEILFLDDHGIHVSGPSITAGAPQPPTLPPDAEILDLSWDNDREILVLYTLAGEPWLTRGAGATQVTFRAPAGTTSIDLAGGAWLTVITAGGVARLDHQTGSMDYLYAVPSGWDFGWLVDDRPRIPEDPGRLPQLIAFAPTGGTGIYFDEPPGGTITPRLFELPRGFRASALSGLFLGDEPYPPAFVGIAANGSWTHVTLDFAMDAPPSTGNLTISTVLVKRESAQSVFGQLTSPPIAATLGVFALMAGAFGPAALAGLTDVSQSDKRGTTMGLYSVVISSSMIVGPVVTGYLVDNYGGFGVMVFLVCSAAAMGLFMALRALDVRRAGGEQKLREEAAKAPSDPAPKAPAKGPVREEE